MPLPCRLPSALPLSLALLALGVVPAAGAIPLLELSDLPRPAAGERRWLIQLPGVLRPGADPGLSADPADWRLQLIVGQMVLLDCNRQSFNGRWQRLNPEAEQGPLQHRVTAVGPLASTRMACPPDQPRRRVFLPMVAEPLLLPYSVSRPIVVDAPAPLELRWRLWKPEREERPARLL